MQKAETRRRRGLDVDWIDDKTPILLWRSEAVRAYRQGLGR